MLILGHIAALDVAERRVRIDDARIAQVLQRQAIALLARAVQPTLAKGQRTKVLVDVRQQRLGPLGAQGYVAGVGVAHIVGAVQVLVDVALARAAERFNRVKLSLLID